MSHVWTFSKTSESLLQQCLEAAGPPDYNNKWMQAFGAKNQDLSARNSTASISNDCPHDEETSTPFKVEEENEPMNTYDDTIDLISRFDHFQEECLRNHKKLLGYALKLPIDAIENLLNHIFENRDVKHDFLKLFFEYFMPSYIKRDSSRLCTDLLLKTHSIYPQYFKNLLKFLITDVEVQNHVLQEFVQSLDANKLAEFLTNVAYIELTAVQFVCNIFVIYTAYKTCCKTEKVQNFIFYCLKNYSNDCINNKNYGRLMLCYLQYEKTLKHSCQYYITVLHLLETHKSAFRRPCMTIFQEMKDIDHNFAETFD